jgi:VanZ family protein
VFVPGRTPSLTDIYAQAIGTACGFAAWAVLGREARALFATYASGQRRALETALVGYAAVQAFLLLEPFRVSVDLGWLAAKYRDGAIVLNPLSSPALAWDQLPAVLADFALAAPVGALMVIFATSAARGRRSLPVAIALGAAFFAAGELAQVFIRGRTADIVDLLANVMGMATGAVLARVVTGRAVVPGPETGTRDLVLVGGLVMAALLYVTYNLTPFDFSFSREMAFSRLDRFARVPFHGYYQNPEFKALRDAFTKISLALPFGLLFQLRFRPDLGAYRRTVTTGWLLLTALFFSVVELGQVFVRGRFPDNTDVLLAIAGVWLGIRVTRPFLGTNAEWSGRSAAPLNPEHDRPLTAADTHDVVPARRIPR